MGVGTGEDEAWRVVLLPGLKAGQTATIKSFTLPDPRTGRPQGFLLYNGSLLEVNRFKQAHNAWLAGERLLADGGVFLATTYDPLFVLLPVLDRARDKGESCHAGKFKELDEILYDASTPGFSELLQYVRGAAAGSASGASGGFMEGDADAQAGGTVGASTTAAGEGLPGPNASKTAEAAKPQPGCAPSVSLEQQLACICDIQKVDETCYYRLNEDRVLAWLLCKFRQMQAALAAQVTGMDPVHAASYVLAGVAEYVGESWIGRLAQHLGINDKEAAGTALQPADGNTQGAHRPAPYSAAGPPEKKQKIDPRSVAKQATLAKQAVGTKKLTSFFTKK